MTFQSFMLYMYKINLLISIDYFIITCCVGTLTMGCSLSPPMDLRAESNWCMSSDWFEAGDMSLNDGDMTPLDRPD